MFYTRNGSSACDWLKPRRTNGSPHRDYLISIDDFPSSPTTHRSNSTGYPDTSLKFQELINQHLLRKLGSHKSNNLSARSRPRRSRIGLYPTRPSTIRNRLAAFNDPLSISFFSFFRNLPALHPAFKNAVSRRGHSEVYFEVTGRSPCHLRDT
jgi:hypothetical protein